MMVRELMSKISFILCLLLTIVLGVFFRFNSHIDLHLAHVFYTSAQGFTWANSSWALNVRYALYAAVWATALIFLTTLAWRLCSSNNSKLPRVKTSAYVLTVFFVVPFLVVNVGFKNHFGRPRPRQVTEFASTMQFQHAWQISDECSTNCSFVCGDAAVAFTFWLFLPFFKRRRWRLAYGTGVFLLGSFYGWIRMGQGGHFFSDVLFAALLTYLSIWIIYKLFYRRPLNLTNNN